MSKLTPDTKIHQLAEHPLLNALSGVQLIVYLRLLGATRKQRTRRVSIRNIDLYKQPRAAVRALNELRDMGLVKICSDFSAWQRLVEVL